MTFFVIFHKIFRKLEDFFFKFESINPIVRGYQSTLRVLRTLLPIMTAQIFVVYEI